MTDFTKNIITFGGIYITVGLVYLFIGDISIKFYLPRMASEKEKSAFKESRKFRFWMATKLLLFWPFQILMTLYNAVKGIIYIMSKKDFKSRKTTV